MRQRRREDELVVCGQRDEESLRSIYTGTKTVVVGEESQRPVFMESITVGLRRWWTVLGIAPTRAIFRERGQI